MRISYPSADPSWDYYQIYGILVSSGYHELINKMSQIEDATEETDKALAEDLTRVIDQLTSARSLLNNK